MSSCQPLYGKLSDIFGRKPCVLTAYSVFAVGSLACGLAQSMEQFIAARVSASHRLMYSIFCMSLASLHLVFIFADSNIGASYF